MFSYIQDFCSKHRRKLIFGGVIIGGLIFGTKCAQKKLIEWQERETRKLLEKTKKQHYFDSTEKTCNQTIYSLGSTLRDNINSLVKCEEILQQLKEGSSNKLGLWNELKVLVFTKVSLMVYAGALLVIALRIQLNIVGGNIYNNGNSSRVTSSLQEKYLSQCNYFLDCGLKELYSLIKEKVEIALKDISLNQSMTLQHVENIFWAIQSSINNDSRNPLKKMSHLLFGKDIQVKEEVIIEMTMDTIDLLERVEVIDLATSCISRGYSNVVDNISDSFLPNFKHRESHPSTSKEVNNILKFTSSTNIAKPFAKIIPIINGIGNSRESWISPFIYMETLQILGANIYESYSSSGPS